MGQEIHPGSLGVTEVKSLFFAQNAVSRPC